MRRTRQRPRGWRPLLEALEDRLVPATYTVNSLTDTGSGGSLTGDLRYCITQADANPGSTIVFDATAFANAQTITLSGTALPDLSQSMQIDGPAAGVTVNAAGKSQVFAIDSGATVTISGLTITGGSASVSDPKNLSMTGGGINNRGTLTLSDCTVSGNTSGGGIGNDGGGIGNFGSLVLNNCTLRDNAAIDGNAGGLSNSGTAVLTNCTLSDNAASSGGALSSGGGLSNAGVLTMSGCTLSGNTAGNGGGVYNSSTVTLTDCTLAGNSAADQGGGLFNYGLPNPAGGPTSTPAADQGGGLFNYGTVALTNCTLSGNSAGLSAGGFFNAVFTAFGSATLTNTIVAGNSANGAPDDVGGPVLARNCLIQSTSGTTFTAGSSDNITGQDPLLAPLGNYGGPTQTMALLPASPALGAGEPVYAVDQNGRPLATDQRGLPRLTNGLVDIGAFQLQGTITVNSAADTDARDDVLTLREALLVVDGTLPVSDLTAAERQQVSADPGEPGAYVILFDPTVFATNQTITLDGTALPDISKSVTIDGPAAVGVTVNAALHSRVFVIDAGVTVAISNLIISGGASIENGTFDPAAAGGGINNHGTLTLTDCTVSGNTADGQRDVGGGIANFGSLTLSGCTFLDNGGGYAGGGLYSDGTATLSDCTFRGNLADFGGGLDNDGGTVTLTDCTLSGNSVGSLGGGLLNYGTATLTDCTLSGNTADFEGGGLFNAYLTTLVNCTLGGNTAKYEGGGMYNRWSATLTNCTLAGNTAFTRGGGLYNSFATLTNTLVAGNSANGGPDDVAGRVTAQNSLIQSIVGTIFTANSANNILGRDPLLAPLGSYFPTFQPPPALGLPGNHNGPPPTCALLPGSPALDAGTSTGAPANDERGVPRVGAVDIGAFESQGFTLTVLAGANQATTAGTAFPTALAVKVTANYPLEPVQGGVVTFTAPAGGASGTFANGHATATIDASGTATAPPLTANGTAGNFAVTASAAGATAPVSFPLTNTPAVIPPSPPVPPTTPPGLDANGRFVYHLYQDLLGRQPGPSEAGFFTTALDQGALTQAQVASFFASSPEFHEHQIDQLYVRLLGRHVDAATAALFAAGGNLGQIKAVILGSDEYSQLHGGTATGFLQGLGQNVLGGSIDPADLGLFQSELAAGTPRFAVALQALAEPQAAAAEAGRLYQQILQRSASASELAVPAALVLQGDEADLLLALVLSDEFANLP